MEDHASQVLKIYLMDDARTWWDNLEVVEGLAAPLQELESLSIPVELDYLVLFGGVWSAEHISLNRVVNDQIYWAEWVDLGWVATKSLHGISHGGQINYCWDTTIKKLRIS